MSLRLNQYQYNGKIGEGAFGLIEVYVRKEMEGGPGTGSGTGIVSGTETGPNEFVVKNMEVGEHLSQVVREIELYKKFRHPNIVKYIGHRYGSKSLLMLERGRCCLGDFIRNGKYDIEHFYKWIHGVATGLDYMHHNNFIHTDLKPENIIMFRSETTGDFFPKICDLGCSQYYFADRDMNCYIQTEYYRAPEIKDVIDRSKSSTGYQGRYNFKIDCWSLGVMTVDLFCRQYSYNKIKYYHPDHVTTVRTFCAQKGLFPFEIGLVNILVGLLEHNPEKRWSIKQLLDNCLWSEKIIRKQTVIVVSKNSEAFTCANAGAHVNATAVASATATAGANATATALTCANAGAHVPATAVTNVTATAGANTGAHINANASTEVEAAIIEHVFGQIKYDCTSKAVFRYPIQDHALLDLARDYYSDLPEFIVSDGFYYFLKISKKLPKINSWRLIQYCIYILNLLYYQESNDFYLSIYQFKKRDVFQILNATDFVIV